MKGNKKRGDKVSGVHLIGYPSEDCGHERSSRNSVEGWLGGGTKPCCLLCQWGLGGLEETETKKYQGASMAVKWLGLGGGKGTKQTAALRSVKSQLSLEPR